MREKLGIGKFRGGIMEQRTHWQICGGGFGIHWPDIDEDLSTAGLLRGAPAAANSWKQESLEPLNKPETQSQILSFLFPAR
ncbi:MAG: DUF2442 domain-containing protein [bacterium]